VVQKDLAESEVSVVSPLDLGGFKSEEYLKISPQGKVPSMKCESGLCIAESDTVCRYIMSTYADQGPSFQPDNPRSNQISRFHDFYLTTIQNCLYKPGPPFGIYGDRKQALAEYSKQLYVIADLMEDDAMYACGDEVSLADATLFPSVIFAVHLFPKFDSGLETPIPPKIEAWFQGLIEKDSAFKKAYDEVGYVLSISIPSLNLCFCASPSACISSLGRWGTQEVGCYWPMGSNLARWSPRHKTCNSFR
jgi:glutathione S-transferase